MLYCFLEEDMEGLLHDPLIFQKEYAKRLGALLIGSLKQQTVCKESKPAVFGEEKVLLRCTCDHLEAGLHLLKQQGARLLETGEDVKRIEDWYTLGLTRRNIWEVNLTQLPKVLSELPDFVDNVFVKSKQKGFSAVIGTGRIKQQDSEVVAFLEAQCEKYGERMLLSIFMPIKKDSLGVRESRHIIMDNQVTSSSRLVHSLSHTVPRSHRNKAGELAWQIKELGIFPANYVLDLGEFVDRDGNSYLDIVEVNPLSCSMCYVNNSVFDAAVPEIIECRKSWQMGYEFCFDAIHNAQRYTQKRTSAGNYAFTSEDRYFFL